jgi:Sel1 repeat
MRWIVVIMMVLSSASLANAKARPQSEPTLAAIAAFEDGAEAERSNQSADKYFVTACEGGFGAGCYRAANRMGSSDEYRDDRIKLFERGCTLGDLSSCSLLGSELTQPGPHRNMARAISLGRQTCDQGLADGCAALGFRYQQLYGWGDARQIAAEDRACNGRHWDSCEALGLIWLNPAKEADRNLPRALHYLERACDGGRGFSCKQIAELYSGSLPGIAIDRTREQHYFDRSCKQKYYLGCTLEAELFLSGKDFPADVARALSIYEGVCADPDASSNNQSACIALGQLHQQGRSVPISNERAATYYRKALGWYRGNSIAQRLLAEVEAAH